MSRFIRRICIFFGGLAAVLPLAAQHLTPVTLKDIQGTWTDIRWYQYVPEAFIDAAYETAQYTTDIWISGDTIRYYEYPCKYIGMQRIRIEGDSLYFDDYHTATYRIGRENDLIRLLDGAPGVHEETWRKQKFDERRLRQLARDGVWYGCLTGKLVILREESYQDGAEYKLDPPFPLPATLHIRNEAMARSLATDSIVLLPVYGKPREFKITGLDWSTHAHNESAGAWNYPRVYLTPGDWWKGRYFSFEYRKPEYPQQRNATTVWPTRPLKLEFDHIRRLQNPQVQWMASLLDSMGFVADPFWAQQNEEFTEICSLSPRQTGKYAYYLLPADSEYILRRIRHPQRNEGTETDTIDYSSLQQVRRVYAYYFHRATDDPRNHELTSGLMEIWELPGIQQADAAYRFLEAYILKDDAPWAWEYGAGQMRCFRHQNRIYLCRSDNYLEYNLPVAGVFRKIEQLLTHEP